MENTELMNPQSAEMLEKVLVVGDLSALTPSQRLDYYRQVCQSCGLNPLTRPFDYIRLNGKLTLYAKKDATDQLRKIHGVSIDDVQRDFMDDLIIATAKGHDATGRTDFEIGVVSKKDMQGNLANALMKAITKAKRRLTLSLCGLGWLDETEVETIPDVKPVVVDDAGNIVEGAQNDSKGGSQQNKRIYTPDQKTPVEPPEKPEFDEDAFLAEWSRPSYVLGMNRKDAETMLDSKGKPYGEKSTYELFQMLNSISRAIKKAQTDEQKEQYALKVSAICEILQNRKLERQLAEERPDPNAPKGE